MELTTSITVLIDNDEADGACGTSGESLCSEWGLSLLVRRGDTSVLLDFGQSGSFARNAEYLSVDLGSVNCAVLSHAHYDHADGMSAFFDRNPHAPLYMSEACKENCWSTKGGTVEPHYIGIKSGLLERHAKRLVAVPTDRTTTIAPGFHVIPHTTAGLAQKGERDGMLLQMAKDWQPDGFAHEVTLVVELGEGDVSPLAVLNSCSHAGVATILQEVSSAFPGRHIAAFVGGLHLLRSSDRDILRTAEDLRRYDVCQVYIGHCTGDRALELLVAEMPGHVTPLRTGSTFWLGGM